MKRSFSFAHNGLRIGDGGALKNVSTTFAQMPDRILNVEFTTVGPTIVNTTIAVRLSLLVIYTFNT